MLVTIWEDLSCSCAVADDGSWIVGGGCGLPEHLDLIPPGNACDAYLRLRQTERSHGHTPDYGPILPADRLRVVL